MGGGQRRTFLAISKEILSDLLAGKIAANLSLHQVTAADAGSTEAIGLLPFADKAEVVESYLRHFEMWLVTPPNLAATVLLCIRRANRRDVRDDEVEVLIAGAIPDGPAADESAAIKATVESLRLLGARKLSRIF